MRWADAAIASEGTGKWVKLAAKRFLNDLERLPFSRKEANDACEFIEKLPHVEGTWDTPNLRLHPSSVFVVVNLFGFRRADGVRRFSTALYCVARKNAKSTLAAAILLYCLLCEDEVGPQVISAATTGSQARIIFNIAKRMVEKTADLREAFHVEPFANAIASYGNGGTLKPINAKASTQDGLNPSVVCLDELHAHKTHDLLNVLKSAAGARRNPLFLYTTTEGYESPGPWPEERRFAEQVLQGIVEADHYFAVIFALDDDDEDFDERAWVKANPLLEVNQVLLDKIREDAVEAKQMPGRLAEFRIKRLNRRASVQAGWVDYVKWKSCGGAFDLAKLVGHRCWGAFDLSSNRDLTAWALLWLVDGIWYCLVRCFVPARAVHARTERGTVPYGAWVSSGWLEETPGEVTDYAVLEAAILEDFEKYKPRAIAYDDWNAAQLVARIGHLPLQKFIQGPRSYHPAMQAFERAYTGAKLRHGDNPVLTWNAANIVTRLDQNLNMAPDKKRSADKIDGLVALLMAFGVAVKEQPNEIRQGFVVINA